MRRIYLYVIPLLSFLSCTEVIEVDLNEGEPRLIVEGLITDEPGPHYVKLTKTTSFYSDTPPSGIPDAEVIVRDSEGNTDTLVHTADGIYETQTIEGITGRTYFLEITVGGEKYFSESTLFPVTEIDSVKIIYQDSSLFVQEGYYLAFFAQEPQQTEDYYLWKFYKNRNLQNIPDDIHISDDAAIQQNILGLLGPYRYELGDTARVEMYSITREAYDFYSGANTNLNNDGGFFSSPPSNPSSNISNGALGLFQTSAVEREEVVVE